MKIFFLISVFVFCISCIFQTNNKNSADYSKIPVLFIHGHGMDSNSWKKFTLEFQKKGYPNEYLYAIDIIPNTLGNIEAAEMQIAPQVEIFLEQINRFLLDKKFSKQKSKIDIVSFSMGALSARWYAARISPEKVRTLISIGGANHGTDVLCNWADDGAMDLCPAFAASIQKSFIQYELNGQPFTADVDETPFGIGQDANGVVSIMPDENRKIMYVTVRSEIDPWIKPGESAKLDGSGKVKIKNLSKYQLTETSSGNYLFNKFQGHDELLEKENIIDFIYEILNRSF